MGLQTAAWTLAGSATTMLTRRATRSAMRTRQGTPRLPRAARENDGWITVLLLGAAGAAQALTGSQGRTLLVGANCRLHRHRQAPQTSKTRPPHTREQ